jgi:hypothetical protein
MDSNFTRTTTDSSDTGSPNGPRRQPNPDTSKDDRARRCDTGARSSTNTNAAPPSRAARPSRTPPPSPTPRSPPARTTRAKPPDRNSSSAHDAASGAGGRNSSTPPGESDQYAPATTPAPSTQAARSPADASAPHAARNTAVAPPPGCQSVTRPRGRPPAGNAASSPPIPVGTAPVVPARTGCASGNRRSSSLRSSSTSAGTAPTSPPFGISSGLVAYPEQTPKSRGTVLPRPSPTQQRPTQRPNAHASTVVPIQRPTPIRPFQT